MGVRLADIRLADPAHFRRFPPPRPLYREQKDLLCHDLRQRDRQRRSRIAALCADIGLDYQGVLQVVMPENYVAMFNVPGAEESAQIITAAQPSIDRGIACVQRGEPFPAPKVGRSTGSRPAR